MNRFLVLIVGPLLTFFIVAADWNTAGDDARTAAAQDQSKTYNLTVKKINNQWKVVISGTSNTEVKAKRGDKIVWKAEGSDMYFQFLDTNLFGGFTREVKSGKQLTVVVGNKARRGVNYYAVFCTATKQFATGGSPPKIIIE